MSLPDQTAGPTRDAASAPPLAVGARLDLMCGRAADRKVGMRPGVEVVAPCPVMFNVAHGIEMTLKSRLKGVGVSFAERSGHDLERLVDRCSAAIPDTRATLSRIDRDVPAMPNDTHVNGALRYGARVTGGRRPVFGGVPHLAGQSFDACDIPTEEEIWTV